MLPDQRHVTVLEEYFHMLQIMPNDCWEWRGSLTKQGYGQVTRRDMKPKGWMAHRLAWVLAYGPIPKGLWVLHKCDNRPCINPLHLFLGTQSDNVRDCVAKGRHAAVKLRGVRWEKRGKREAAAKVP